MAFRDTYGVAFRATETYVTDGPDDTYSLGRADSPWPTIRNGITFGYVTTDIVQARNRYSTIDPRIAGMHFWFNNTTQVVFDLQLENGPGTYDVVMSVGDPNSGSSGRQLVEVYDYDGSTETFLFAVDELSVPGRSTLDANGTPHDRDDWGDDQVPFRVTASGDRLRFKCGDPAETTEPYINFGYFGVVFAGGGPPEQYRRYKGLPKAYWQNADGTLKKTEDQALSELLLALDDTAGPVTGSGSFAGSSTFSADGKIIKYGAGSFAGSAAFNADGKAIRYGFGSFAGSSAFSADGAIGGGILPGSGSFAGSSAFSADGKVITYGSGAFAGTSAFQADGVIIPPGVVIGSGSFAGSSDFSANGVGRYLSSGAFAGMSAFSADGTIPGRSGPVFNRRLAEINRNVRTARTKRSKNLG